MVNHATGQLFFPNIKPGRFLPPEAHLPQLQRALLDWFAAHKRPLPWRASYTPYEVWISEIMLQQTRMGRGVEYFKRWMKRFPDMRSLASASEEEVLRLWEGLGYYSRARHILSAARLVMKEHKGIFPSDPAQMRALPGIGPYTAGAVASIAFGEKLPCIDANVERVISRIFDIDTPVKQEPAASKIRELALALVPEGKAREHNQAMMELGALVCGKKPRCERCPAAMFCVSRNMGIAGKRPVPGKKAAITPVVMATGVLRHNGRIFLQQRLTGGVWGNLWEFPGGRVENNEHPAGAAVREFMEETGFAVTPVRKYGIIRHGYTTYRIAMHCFELRLSELPCPQDSFPRPVRLTSASSWRWADPEAIAALPMPAPHRRLADTVFRMNRALR
ncbi:MAG: A/G-specific adenine glycosylase [Desulfovibrio sp.]|jgi:A/G-specific adenine glycosylase|nr:A/G-specific adenine glycosylase [Desulfovibrio sp.]